RHANRHEQAGSLRRRRAACGDGAALVLPTRTESRLAAAISSPTAPVAEKRRWSSACGNLTWQLIRTLVFCCFPLFFFPPGISVLRKRTFKNKQKMELIESIGREALLGGLVGSVSTAFAVANTNVFANLVGPAGEQGAKG